MDGERASYVERLLVVGNGATAVDAADTRYVNRHTAQLLVDLGRSGIDVTYVEPRAAWRANGNLQDSQLPKTDVRSVPLSKSRPASFLRAGFRLLRADFVYLFFPGRLPRLAARICRTLRIPYALYLRGEQFSTLGADAQTFRHARFICAVSGIGDKLRHLNHEVVAIRPMLDLSVADAARRSFHRRDDKPWRGLFVGRLEEAKGIPELVQAVQLLHDRGFPFTLTLVGGGPLFQELQRRFGSGPLIQLRGIIDSKSALMAEYEAAEFFIIPTHHEGFPRVLYEAMIKSVVIVTTFVGGIPGLMVSGENCVEIRVRDPDAIADAIMRTADDSNLMQTLADNALQTVMTVLNTRPSHLQVLQSRFRA